MPKSDQQLELEHERLLKEVQLSGVSDERVLKALAEVPRHLFVPIVYRSDSYLDIPLPIGKGQTISQPSVVGLMTQYLALSPEDTVLEVGTGSGYQSAIVSRLAKEVYTIERINTLEEDAKKLLEELGYKNIHVFFGDGSRGLPDFAPYDAIIVTAAAKDVPGRLVEQLKEGGRIIIPVGHHLFRQVLKFGIKRDGKMVWQSIEPVAFVPLIED